MEGLGPLIEALVWFTVAVVWFLVRLPVELLRLAVGCSQGKSLKQVLFPATPEERVRIPQWLGIGMLLLLAAGAGAGFLYLRHRGRLNDAAAELLREARGERVLGLFGRVILHDEGDRIRVGDRHFGESNHLSAFREMVRRGLLTSRDGKRHELTELGKERLYLSKPLSGSGTRSAPWLVVEFGKAKDETPGENSGVPTDVEPTANAPR